MQFPNYCSVFLIKLFPIKEIKNLLNGDYTNNFVYVLKINIVFEDLLNDTHHGIKLVYFHILKNNYISIFSILNSH